MPNKKYYRIGEVSKLTGVEPHVLRYWEGEFQQIQPHRVARQRLYRLEDVTLIKRIRRLLHDEGFTIAGAKKKLGEEQKKRYAQLEVPMPQIQERAPGTLLDEIRRELLAIKDLLSP